MNERGGRPKLTFRKGNVVNLLVVGNELGLGLTSVNVPDRARGIYRTGANYRRIGLVPVEGGEGGTVLRILIVVEEVLHLANGSVVGFGGSGILTT